MTREQAHILVVDIIRDILGDSDVVVTDATMAAEVPGWDSLAHIDILATAEIRLGIEIRASEAEGLRTVGELIDLILAKAPAFLDASERVTAPLGAGGE